MGWLEQGRVGWSGGVGEGHCGGFSGLVAQVLSMEVFNL